MIKIRKFLNIPSKEEKELIKKDCELILESVKKYQKEENNKDSERKKISDNTCVKCSSEKIVDKITQTTGHGSVSGSFRFGHGSVSGQTNIDTKPVNHCSECGHQWEKYKLFYHSQKEILDTWFFVLGYTDLKNYTKTEVYKLLKGYSAESILESLNLIKNNRSVKDKLTLRFLRKYFKSVYD